MIRAALDSFARRDLGGAESLVDLDEVIDRANIRLVQHLLDVGDEPAVREWGVCTAASRCLERIGDHAVDIGEQTAFLVTGQFREFTDASRPVEVIGGGLWGGPPRDCLASPARPEPADGQPGDEVQPQHDPRDQHDRRPPGVLPALRRSAC